MILIMGQLIYYKLTSIYFCIIEASELTRLILYPVHTYPNATDDDMECNVAILWVLSNRAGSIVFIVVVN
jgi:hypothetical protein